jgi:hypothetical protein
MAALGFTWVRAQLPDALVRRAKERKASTSWDDYLAALIERDTCDQTSRTQRRIKHPRNQSGARR